MFTESIIPSDNKHAKYTRERLGYLKHLTYTLDNWTLDQESEGAKLYTQQPANSNEPILVRGDTVLTKLPPGCTPLTVATVATLPGCRKIWDDKYDQSEIKEYYTRYESLLWVKLKAPWPISPRDFAATSIRDVQPAEVYCSITSVEDDAILDTPSTVRGRLYISGWKLYATDEGHIGITYVNQVDLAGSLPWSFVRKMLIQSAACAAKVRQYIENYGFPPITQLVHHDAVFLGEEFEHETRRYSLDLKPKSQHAQVEIVCSHQMYPQGIQLEMAEGSAEMKQVQDNDQNYRITLKDLKGDRFRLILTKK
ncbi:hypothetical protein A0J61_01826 [Choanephora cucurbitarum]|uniref:START domain-containing protein n=1 Tax=Choanephora cucurbitarum TaxID=101091 RepID=A0A1C7NM32_9FUNG|nr:hypothetical protein A0J61_01826 [Choanephora cucurbitarum]